MRVSEQMKMKAVGSLRAPIGVKGFWVLVRQALG
jgi:hypothetical protein